MTSDFAQFVELAKTHTLIPVVRTLHADLLTPVSAFLAVAGKEPQAFLLESVERGEHVGRYTFLGARPYMHGQFIHAVAEGRGAKDEDIKKIADGRVWTGQQAVAIKLIDQVADFRGAVKDTAKSVGIKGDPNLVRPVKPRRTLSDLLFGDVSEFLPDKAKMLETHVGFYYLWQ